MATYVYETVPRTPTEQPRRFEVVQRMRDAPLTHHPDTGEPVRRVITGGFGYMKAAGAPAPAPAASTGGCSPGCACHSGPRVPPV